MAYNTILIKRRLPGGSAGAPTFLSGGELAFNEVDSTLYYGSSAGVISIAGNGAFVNRTTDQTISGNKTFLGSTTLSSTTFSPDSVIDLGGNVITNLGAPVLSSDAATKKYIDDEIASLGSSGSSATEALSTEIYNTFVKLTDDRAVDLSGGLTVTSGITSDSVVATGNVEVGGNLTVTGDFQVLGTVTTLETTTTVTSAFSISNAGSETAFTVTQTGSQNVAEFYDDANIALAVVDGGNVGIGTLTPNEKLTVTGNISASGTIYGGEGLEVGSNAGTATLWVESGKIGVNTETPSEALTIVGNVSATGNYYGLDVYARNADLTGTLDVDGAATLNSTLDVTSAATFASSVSALGTLTVEGATTLNNTLDVTGAVDFDSTLNVDSYATFNDTVTVTNNLSANSDVVGTQYVSKLVDFIIDGGEF